MYDSIYEGSNAIQFVSIDTVTDGRGEWTTRKAEVEINSIRLTYCDEERDSAELWAEFDMVKWNIDIHGLIYTDDSWLSGFHAGLQAIGFSADAVSEICYSDQRMQGRNFVSMYVTEKFIKEWIAKYGELELTNDY